MRTWLYNTDIEYRIGGNNMTDPVLIPIADGVSLCAVQTDRFKTCRLSLSAALPLAGDIAAAAVLPYILRRSCRKYPDMTSMNGHLDMLYGAALGAAVTKKGEAQILHLSVTAIDDRFALSDESVTQQAAALLFDLLFDPKLEDGMFPAADVDAEKRLLLARMRSEDDEKRVYARRRCEEVMCEHEAYGQNRYGTAQQIESLTPQRVYDAWRRVLETATIRLVTVSGTDADAVRQLFSDGFAGVSRRVRPIETQFVPVPTGDVKTVRETQNLQQGTLVLGLRCGMTKRDDMDPVMLVMNDMFGGGVYSKLFTVVREKMSLCYYCRSILNRDKGTILIACGIETENEQKTVDAILSQLSDMQRGDFTRETFNASVRSLTDSIRGYNDAPDVLCAWYGHQIFRNTVMTPQARIEQIENVSFDEIRHTAQQVRLDTIFMLAGTGADNHA